MHYAKKHFTAFLSAMALSLASVGTSISAFAKEAETTKPAETTAVTEATASEEDMKKLVDEIQDVASKDEDSESDESEHDYYVDDYYDTDGNATLIKHEKIIYDSEEMQFIAVTTKDGNVFYILINYSADGNEDNVFFLNNVNVNYGWFSEETLYRYQNKKGSKFTNKCESTVFLGIAGSVKVGGSYALFLI